MWKAVEGKAAANFLIPSNSFQIFTYSILKGCHVHFYVIIVSLSLSAQSYLFVKNTYICYYILYIYINYMLQKINIYIYV